jgi:hypothetical protein
MNLLFFELKKENKYKTVHFISKKRRAVSNEKLLIFK